MIRTKSKRESVKNDNKGRKRLGILISLHKVALRNSERVDILFSHNRTNGLDLYHQNSSLLTAMIIISQK